MIQRLLLWADDRFGTARFLHHALKKAFPDHWSFMLGEINIYAFIVLLATGTFLALWFVPAHTNVVYDGPYTFLRGDRMSQAYDSVLHISFAVNAGLLIRQIHHWAANIFVAGIVVHMGRIFFTAAFRNPRELNWIIGVLLLFAAMFEGFTGYSMPDDLLSGIGLRIADSILQSVPFIGTWAMFFLTGGVWPPEILIQRLFVLHVFIMPALITLGITVHLMILWRQKHTQFPGPRRTEENVVGSPLFPTYTVKSLALQMGVIAMCCALGAFVQINPVWLWGPYQTWRAISPAQPDWYIGWLEGALRIEPHWAIHLFGHMIPSPFWAGVLLPGVVMLALLVYPFAEAKLRGDTGAHHLLNRPRDVPARTGFGVAAFVFMLALFLAGSDDVQARYLHLPINDMVLGYRIFSIAGPVIAFWISYSLAAELKKRGGVHESERVRLTRTPEGGYEEEPIG
ncbi:MAG TPA: cytochrome bc complex cytochrome b subunit [Candidatus Baltobacteraceae bacterium]|jgi:ubiquinol-cytochrome c reductase cytochrome b subunit|nr:cytochrome bc complex cytochrome b subunit [Candidatus Baltobacteraceae bacterium]